MTDRPCFASSCRACRYYNHEGRRGGFCRQLGAPVNSQWTACSLFFPPFAPSWEHFEELVSLSSLEAYEHDVQHVNRSRQEIPTQKPQRSAPLEPSVLT